MSVVQKDGTPARAPVVLGVCIPHQGTMPSGFGFDLANAMAYMGTKYAARKLIDFGVFACEGTYIERSREDLAEEAMREGVTHLMWFDSDMRFPSDTIERLLAHNLPIVGCNYPTRRFPVAPTGIREGAQAGKPAVRFYPTEGVSLEEADALGFGCILVKAEVFASTPRPWFAKEFKRDGDQVWRVGEDVYFLRKAREAGFKTMCDNELSAEILHCGSFEYGMAHMMELREGVEQLAGE